MTPSVSLLIPNRDNEPALDLVFERLAEYTRHPDLEVVVVDDGSTDRSREILRRWRDSGHFPSFTLEEQPPSGVVVALNRGLKLAKGEIVVQLDADATVETPGWLELMLDFFCSDERIGVVVPKVVFDSGAVHAYGVSIVGPAGLHDRGTRVLEPAGERTHHQNVDRPPAGVAPYGERVAEVDSGIGCCMMYRREDALAVGGYDMGFQPVWFDDLDLALSIRLRRAKKVFFLPHVLVTHHIGLRRTRKAPPRREVFQARVGALLPPRVKSVITARTGLGGPPPAHAERLGHHYAYWREKWGWDLLNPDMAEVRRRYGATEVCWAFDPALREQGERIAARHHHRVAIAGVGEAVSNAREFLAHFGFLPPPSWSSLTSYDHILEAIERRGLATLGGDFVEIGAFLGGGVYQLAKLLERHDPARRVFAVDVFSPSVDATANETGLAMKDIYAGLVGDGDQRELYDAVVSSCPNVVTIAGDSAQVDLPTDAVAFAHIDGNHDPAYVRGDFERIWARLLPEGVVAFDDYGHDLPQVTETIDELRRERAGEIEEFWTAGQKTAFLRRRREP